LKQGAKEGIGGGQDPKSKHRTSNAQHRASNDPPSPRLRRGSRM